ncbi:MAG: hypothetical protein ACOX9E_08580 [Lentisphaeria bacterium]|jgi:hypothetical protein
MSENPLGNESKLKLKLKNTDTNRFKVATGRMQKLSTPDEAAEQQEVAPQDGVVNKASVTQPISDPLSLRDTATGKLKRITDTQEAASALAPQPLSAPGAPPQGAKTETVRLKVVRSAARPTVNLTEGGPQVAPPARPTISLTPAAAPQSAEAAPEAPVAAAPATPPPAAPAVPPAAAAPAEPTAPTEPAKVKSETQTVPKIPKPSATPAAAATPPTAAEEDSTDGKPIAAAAPKVSSSTIKLNIRKPGAPAAAEQTVQVAPPDAERTAQVSPPTEAAGTPTAPPPVPGASSTLKIRPADGSAPAPAAAAPDSSASATVKIKAPPPATGGDKKKITLRKDLPPVTTPEPAPPVPPAAAATAATAEPESPAPESAQTVAVPAPPAEQKKGGLKIRTGGASSAATQAAVPPPAAAAAAAEKSEEAPAPVESAFPAGAGEGVSVLELVTTSVAAIAVVVSIVRFVLDMVQQIQ